MKLLKSQSSPQLNGFMGVAMFLIFYSLIGCMIIFNVTRGSAKCMDFVQRQLTFSVLCLAMVLLLFSLSEATLKRLLLPACIVLYLALWGLFAFGTRINGAYGWYRLGTLSIQPSELAKPCFIVALAVFCQKIKAKSSQLKRFLLQLAFCGIALLPIACQPDFGTVLVYGITFVFIIWVDGMPNKYLLALAGMALSFVGFALLNYGHVRKRFASFFTTLFLPDAHLSYHAQRLQECIVKGGWTGVLRHPNDALHALPLRYSDSLFAGATELLGAAGVIPIVLICTAWHYYCSHLAAHEQDATRRLIFHGAGVMLSSQALIHLAVNLGLMPNTGITMPLFSYGGSSLLATFAIVAIVQRLSLKPQDASADQQTLGDALPA